MAYEFTATSSRYLSVPSAVVTQEPLTMACWCNANTTSTMALMSIQTLTQNQRFQLILASQQVRAGKIGNVSGVAQTTGTFATQQWFHAAGVFETSSLRTAYRDAGNTGTNTTSVTISETLSQTTVGAARSLGSLGFYFDGLISEVGIWNAALTAAEVASLAKGMTCDKVRPQSLVFYAPLIRDLIDAKGGLTITNNNGATVANHPRIYA
jgi:hypothetical protein